MSDSSDTGGHSSFVFKIGLVFLVISGFGLYITGSLTEETTGFDYPEGADADGVNMAVLSESHDEMLSQTTYVYTYNQTIKRAEATETVEVIGTFGETDSSVKQNDNGTLSEYYLKPNGKILFEKKTVDGEVVYSNRPTYNLPASATAKSTRKRFLEDSVGGYKIEFVNTTTTDGVAVATYRFDGYDDNSQHEESKSVDVRGTMAVAEDGYVTDVQVTLNSHESGDVKSTTMAFTDVGSTTITEPDWLAKAFTTPDELKTEIKNSSTG